VQMMVSVIFLRSLKKVVAVALHDFCDAQMMPK